MNASTSTRSTFDPDGEPPNPSGVFAIDYSRLDADLILWLARREARRTIGGRKPRRRSIYERDGWRCGLCLGPVDRRLSLPHPHAATLDHMTPRAHGGSNDPTNLQTAHAICNHVRGDLPLSAVNPVLFAELFEEAARWTAIQSSGRAEARMQRARRRWFKKVHRIRAAFKAGGSGPFETLEGTGGSYRKSNGPTGPIRVLPGGYAPSPYPYLAAA